VASRGTARRPSVVGPVAAPAVWTARACRPPAGR